MAELTVFSTVGEELAKLLSWFGQGTSTFFVPPTFLCRVCHAETSEVPLIVSVKVLANCHEQHHWNTIKCIVRCGHAESPLGRAGKKIVRNYKMLTFLECFFILFKNKFAFSSFSSA